MNDSPISNGELKVLSVIYYFFGNKHFTISEASRLCGYGNDSSFVRMIIKKMIDCNVVINCPENFNEKTNHLVNVYKLNEDNLMGVFKKNNMFVGGYLCIRKYVTNHFGGLLEPDICDDKEADSLFWKMVKYKNHNIIYNEGGEQ